VDEGAGPPAAARSGGGDGGRFMKKWDALLPFLQRGKLDAVRTRDAILESSLPHSEKMALFAIFSHWSEESPRPRPGVRRLAALASQKTDTVLAAIAELERRGLLLVDRRHRQAHEYVLDGLMRGLLAVPPNGTAPPAIGTNEPATPVPPIGTPVPPIGTAVPPIGTVEGVAAVPRIGTDAAELSRSGVSSCPDPVVPLSRSGERKQHLKQHLKQERASTRPVVRTPTLGEGEKREPVQLPAEPIPLPANWRPTEQHRAYAAENGVAFEFEVEAFRGWAEGKRQRSWDGRFRTWLAHGAKHERKHGPPPGLREHADRTGVGIREVEHPVSRVRQVASAREARTPEYQSAIPSLADVLRAGATR
jgi:hypothetical protein